MDEPVRRFGEENISFVGLKLLEYFSGEFGSLVKANKTLSIMYWHRISKFSQILGNNSYLYNC